MATAKKMPEFSTSAKVSFMDDDVEEPGQPAPVAPIVEPIPEPVVAELEQPVRGRGRGRGARSGPRGGRKGAGDDAAQVVLAPGEVPDAVRLFCLQLQRALANRSVVEVQACYDEGFNKLTEKFFKSQPWPFPEAVAKQLDASVGCKESFLLLYRDMYFRHIYGWLQPTAEHRFASWENYCALFDAFLSAAPGEELPLPIQWLWDITDEFLYQFQSYAQYRAKQRTKTAEEIAVINANASAWTVPAVVSYLHRLLVRGRSAAPVAEAGAHPIAQTLGSFALVGLARLLCLLGDYRAVLRVLEPVDLLHKGVLAHVTACHVTLYYYLGFAYLMLRRYTDAVKTFAAILVFLSRAKQYHSRSYQADAIAKKSEQMCALLAIAITLCPQRVDEYVHTIIREKFSDRIARMQKFDESAFEELFVFACPKFVIPCAPKPIEQTSTEEDRAAAESTNVALEAMRQQLRQFLREVQQQRTLATVRSFLKLYTSIPLAKLASFLETDAVATRTQLTCFKHKSRALIWQSGPVADGRWGTTGDVDFVVDGEMVNMREIKVARRYADFFVRHMNKFATVS